jgi:hypothetical protein
MGDDLMDLPVLRLAGVSAAPADAADAVRARVHFVSRLPAAPARPRVHRRRPHAQDRWAAIAERYGIDLRRLGVFCHPKRLRSAAVQAPR